jgi:hypothetical protein
MSFDQFEDEKHNAARLGRFMEVADGKRRPARCHAHAIISGHHRRSARLRGILALLNIRIDDPDNGCWLPENTAATPHPVFPNAVPHSRIHRAGYYRWLTLTIRLGQFTDQAQLRPILKLIARQLQQSTFPPFVMLPKSRRN